MLSDLLCFGKRMIAVRRRLISLKCVLMVAVVAGLPASSSSQHFTLTVSQAEYVELVDPFMLSTPEKIENFYLPSISGFKFTAFGLELGFEASSTGGLGTLISKEGYIAAVTQPALDSIISFHGFLSNHFMRRDSTSSISVVQEGRPGTYILKVQWKNFGFTSNDDADHVNFQVWLHEQDNSVSYHYGPSRVTSNAGFSGAAGPVVGLSQADWPDFASFSKSEYLKGAPAAPSIGHPSFLNVALGGVPPPGTVYTFRPVATANVFEKDRAAGEPLVFFRSHDRLEVTPIIPGSYTFVLLDVTGRELRRTTGNSVLTISRIGLPRGVYFYRLLGGAKEVAAQGTVILH